MKRHTSLPTAECEGTKILTVHHPEDQHCLKGHLLSAKHTTLSRNCYFITLETRTGRVGPIQPYCQASAQNSNNCCHRCSKQKSKWILARCKKKKKSGMEHPSVAIVPPHPFSYANLIVKLNTDQINTKDTFNWRSTKFISSVIPWKTLPDVDVVMVQVELPCRGRRKTPPMLGGTVAPRSKRDHHQPKPFQELLNRILWFWRVYRWDKIKTAAPSCVGASKAPYAATLSVLLPTPSWQRSLTAHH